MKHYPNLFVLEEKEINLPFLAADHKMFCQGSKEHLPTKARGSMRKLIGILKTP